MEQIKLMLDAEQSRFLKERARRLHSTPDALVSSLLTHLARLAYETAELGPHETVQDRMALIAEHYVGESREMLEDDPDLCLDVDDAPEAAGPTLQEETLFSGSGAEEPTAQMSEADIEQAFAEIAEHYEEISREVFGDEPALSADLLPAPHFFAYGLPFPEKPQGTNWTSALIERIEHLLAPRPQNRRPELHHLTMHLWLPTGEQINGPTILYVEPDPARSRLTAAADQ